MKRSESITALIRALSKAQQAVKNAERSAENPSFKSRYATLAAVWVACRGPLTENDLAVVQIPETTERGTVIVETILLHASGEWLSGALELRPQQDGPQAAGSAITYARRYALAALVGVAADDDDDGEQAHGRQPGQATLTKVDAPADPKPAEGVVRQLHPAEDKGRPEPRKEADAGTGDVAQKLQASVIKAVLEKLPPRATATGAGTLLKKLLGPLQNPLAALATAWKDAKLPGDQLPTSQEGWDGLPQPTLVVLYEALYRRLAQFAGHAIVASVDTGKAKEKPKAEEKKPPPPALAPDPKAVEIAASAAGQSVDDFLKEMNEPQPG